MSVFSITGSKFEIGSAVALKSADFVLADFLLAGATEVKEPETFGTMADEWQTEEFGNVTDGRVRTLKIMRKGVPFEVTFGLDPLDAGQLALRAAAAADGNFSFRFTLADKPSAGASPKSSTRIFAGVVLKVEDDASGKIGKMKVTIQPNSNILVTHATAV